MILSSGTRKDMQLFGLEYPFTKDDLRNSYRKLAMKHHSDINQGISEDMIKKINVAKSNLDKIALEKIEATVSLSEELKKKYEQEEQDIFSLYKPCERCHGDRIIHVKHTVAVNCSKCGGTSKVKLKCKYCENGIYTNKRGNKVKCRVCGGTGVWKEVRCNKCSDFSRLRRSSFWDMMWGNMGLGLNYEEKISDEVCPDCQGRGKIKYEPMNPVIKPGAILKVNKRK